MRKKINCSESITCIEPKWNVGDKVVVNFIGSRHESVIIEKKKHPSQDRWIYKVRDLHDGTVIPYVGYSGSEKFANIIE